MESQFSVWIAANAALKAGKLPCESVIKAILVDFIFSLYVS
jgi:hypothetical protein